MTRFQKKERDALDAYQCEMNQFGLYVNKTSFSGSYNSDSTIFNLEIRTNPLPVKGNKALIEKLEAADYAVWKWSRKDENGRRYFVFNVCKIAPIQLDEQDAEEWKVEWTEQPKPFQPEIGKVYENHGGGTFRCLWSNSTGVTFINARSGWKFQVLGVRRYKDGTIVWDHSTGDGLRKSTNTFPPGGYEGRKENGMKIGDITNKLRYCSTGTIEFHIYDKGSGQSEDLIMTPAQIFDLQSKEDWAYPFGATLESIDYIQGKLIINGSLRA